MSTTSDPPCDFITFVAERHGVEPQAAEEQVCDWLTNYEPRSRPFQLVAQPLLDEARIDELRVCA
jgi:hypothetical protein